MSKHNTRDIDVQIFIWITFLQVVMIKNPFTFSFGVPLCLSKGDPTDFISVIVHNYF